MARGEDGDSAWRTRYVLARKLVRDEDPEGLDGVVGALQRLCRSLTTNLHVMGAAVHLMSTTGSEGVVAASDQRAKDIEELQFTTGEGPCHAAFAARRPVLTPHLLRSGSARWPGYTSSAVDAGVAAVFAFPLHIGAVGFGVLGVYSDRVGSLTDEHLAMALTFAQIATETMIDAELTTDRGGLEPGVEAALDYRAEIHQAQGMITVALEVSLTEALARMRAHAFAQDKPLIHVAYDILGGRERLEGA